MSNPMTPIETLNVIVGFARTFSKEVLGEHDRQGREVLVLFLRHAARELGLPSGAIDLALILESVEESDVNA